MKPQAIYRTTLGQSARLQTRSSASSGLTRTTSHSPKWVLADGAFDPIHAGHLRYLQTAARYGTRHGLRLLVRVAPDEVIRAKGREPFQTQQERAGMLRQL